MNLWTWLCDFISSTANHEQSAPVINPSTGLPMINNSIGGIDVGGSPFGQDINHSNSSVDWGSGFDWHDNT